MTDTAKPAIDAGARAEEAARAWREVAETIEAHLQDRVAMRDEANPAAYLRIAQSAMARVDRSTEQLLAARWASERRLRDEVERLSHSTPGDAEVRKALDSLTSQVGHVLLGMACKADVSAAVDVLKATYQDAIKALATPSGRAQGEWRPIETAPKDGTVIDVWRDGTRETVYWGFPPHECGEMGQYCDSDWHSIKKPGWICSTFGEFVGGNHDPFTHWMPLPDAPATPPAQDQKGDSDNG